MRIFAKVIKRFGAPIASAALLCGLSPSASAAPALWSVQSPTAKAYLFGTVHVMKPTTSWHTPALDAAIAQSQTLWLEVPDPTDASAATAVAQLGIDREHPLSTKLSKEDQARLDADARYLGLPGARAMDSFQPWLASITLGIAPLIKAGYDPKNGVDVSLRNLFLSANKPVNGFETVVQQLHYFADMPQAEQIAMLHAALNNVDSATITLNHLVDLWSEGRVEELASSVAASSFGSDPVAFKILVSDRNAAFARKIADRLKGSGTLFVAIGSEHLAGGPSVQDDLTALGYTVSRIQ